MSKTYDTNIGGHKLIINVPASPEEYDALAKKAGACVDAANDYEIFHGTLGQARKAFVKLIEETYKAKVQKVATNQFETDDAGKQVQIMKDEKFEVFLTRVAAENNLEGDAPFQALADRLSAGGDKEIKFDPSVTPRQPGTGPKLPKYAETNAINFLDSKDIPSKPGKKYSLASFGKAFEARMGKPLGFVASGDRTKDIQTLGRLLVEYQNAEDQFAKLED